MASLVHALKADDRSAQTSALLQVLNEATSGRDVSHAVPAVCQNLVAGATVSSQVKALAYDVVHMGVVSSHQDLETVVAGMKATIGGADQDASSDALQLWPSLPAEHIVKLLLEDQYADFLVGFLGMPNPALQSAALAALGHCLSQQEVLAGLAANPGLARTTSEWCRTMVDSIMDADNDVAEAAFAAIVAILEEDETAGSLTAGPATALLHRTACWCIALAKNSLSSLMDRAKALSTTSQVPVVQLLKYLVRSFSQPEDVPLPEDMGFPSNQVSRDEGWLVGAIGSFLEELLSSSDPAVVLEAGRTLLEVGHWCFTMPVNYGSGQISASGWVAKASSALLSLWDKQNALPARPDIIVAVTKHLCDFEAPFLGARSQGVLALIPQLQNADDRVRALAQVWHAVLVTELRIRSERRARGDSAGQLILQPVLEGGFVSSIVSGTRNPRIEPALAAMISRAQYPAFKEELVCSLLQSLMQLMSVDEVQEAFAEADPAVSQSSSAAALKSAIKADRQWQAVDWMAATVVALHEMQACLGWEPEVVEFQLGMTLPSDLWLQLLQAVGHTLHLILQYFGTTGVIRVRKEGGKKNLSDANSVSLLKTAAAEGAEIQKMMRRMLTYWGFLNPALQPRVLWIVTRHLEMPAESGQMWGQMFMALNDVLLVRPSEARKKEIRDRAAAAAEGRMAQMQSKGSGPSTPRSSRQPLAMPPSLDHAEVALEGLVVGMACLRYQADLLAQHAKTALPPKTLAGVRHVAHNLEQICSKLQDKEHCSVDIREMCSSSLQVLAKASEVQGSEPDADGEPMDRGASTGTSTPNESDPNQPMASPRPEAGILDRPPGQCILEGYPFGAPKSQATRHAKRARRHRALASCVQEAVRGAFSHGSARPVGDDPPPVVGQSSPDELAAAVGGLGLKVEDSRAGHAHELTGPGDPVRLTAEHRVNCGARSVTITLITENQLSVTLEGVQLGIAVEGPASAPEERNLNTSWNIPPHESRMHHVELSLFGFGRVELQLKVDLLASGSPVLSCSPHIVSLVDFLMPLEEPTSPGDFYREVDVLPSSAHFSGVCRWPGSEGGLKLLSALETKPLSRVLPQQLMSMGIINAAYVANTTLGDRVAIMISGQLLDMWTLGLAQRAAHSGPGAGYHFVCRITVASSSEKVIAAIMESPSDFLADVSDGGLALGLNPGGGPPPPSTPIQGCLLPDRPLGPDHQDGMDLQSVVFNEWLRLRS